MENYVQRIINEEVSRVLNEIFKRPTNNILELGPTAVSKKRKYARQVWAMIQKAYNYIGGCKSFDVTNGDDGFYDFLNGNYVWRIYFGKDSNDILGAAVYKPTEFGRKRICSCAKNAKYYKELLNHDFLKHTHTYGEVSGKAEKFLTKDDRTKWVDKEKVSDILKKNVSLERDADADEKEEMIKYDPKRHYYRKIGDEMHRKSMYGNPIKRPENKK